MIQVLIVGSLHRDVVVDAPRLPARDETLPGTGFRLVFGGKGGNQAAAAARMGAATAMVGRVGRDAFGRDLLAGLDAAGVDRTLVVEDESAGSGMSVAILDPAGDYGAVIVSGANLAIPPEDAADAVRRLAPRVVVLQNEVPAAVNRAVATAARDIGATVVWNAAPARAVDAALLDAVGVLVVNRVEAAAMADLPVDALADAEVAARSLASPTRDTVVTLGGDGAVLADRAGATRRVPPVPTEVVSTHGAGDMFVGALAARLATGTTLAEALKFASAAAALQVGRDDAGRAALNADAVAATL